MKKRCAFYLIYAIVSLTQVLLRLRYRITVKGMEHLTKERLSKEGGILFLPNHPAEIDPAILMSILWKRFRPRSVTVDRFFDSAFLRFVLTQIGALPFPSMGVTATKWRGKKVDKFFQCALEDLKAKKNFLVYPAGKLKLTGRELLGGVSFVHDLLQASQEANVVLIRTVGLWGSSFSRALTGSVPPLAPMFFDGLKTLLKNGIFFAPRREVTIEIEPAPSDFPYQASRMELNKYLEDWYNRYPEGNCENLRLVSRSFWKEDYPQVTVSEESAAAAPSDIPIPVEVETACRNELAVLAGRAPDLIKREMDLSHDLGLDSLDIAQLYAFLDERFDVANLMPGELKRVEDLMQAAMGLKKSEKNRPSLPRWEEEVDRPEPRAPEGKSIQEAFLLCCDRMGAKIACADAFSGSLSYRRLKLAALILAKKFQELPGDRVGVLLPSSVGAYLVILALLLANKVPVMLNWTVGVRALDHAVEVSQIRAVISSERFLDRLGNVEIGRVEPLLVLLEGIRASISWKDKLCGLLLSWKSTSCLLEKLNLHLLKPSDWAVILFTSGTETLPKGVPLSHHNLLSNQSAVLSRFPVKSTDILYGVLPPFHSLGFSMTGILPLLSGFKVCYAPDPNDSHGLSHDIASWKPTIFCCPPTFIRNLFRVAKVEDLQSLLYVIGGAEKVPQALFDYVQHNILHGQMLEGYGVSECAPIVSLERPGAPHKGVGTAVPGVELCIIDIHTQQMLPSGQEGEICIHGPGVFDGYLGHQKDPFITLEGKRWYRSGDRGSLDPQDGTLFITGRLKRFAKIGGEMVGLNGVEEEIYRLAKEKNWISGVEEGIPLAVSVREKEGEKPLIVLYTTFLITKDEVNNALKESGFGGKIVKVGDVKQLAEIPLTGTGKTHYRLLDEKYG